MAGLKKILLSLVLCMFCVGLFARDIVIDGYGNTAEKAKDNAYANLINHIYGESSTSQKSAELNDLGKGLYSESAATANEEYDLIGIVYSDAIFVESGKYKVSATLSDKVANIYIGKIQNAAITIDAVYALNPSTLDNKKIRLINLLDEIKKYDNYKHLALLLGVDFPYITDYASPVTYQSIYVELQLLLSEERAALNKAATDTTAYNSNFHDAIDNSKTTSPQAIPNIPGVFYSSESKEITIESSTSGVSIYYTTDGVDPSISSFKYSGPFEVSDGITVKAKAFKDGYWSDTVMKVIPSNISVPEIIEYNYKGVWVITIVCKEKEAKIYYTTDGSDPDLNDKEYRNSFDISKSCQIKARAYKDGCWSEIASTQLYFIGAKGPAGGWIFYDVDADNDKGNADGLISSACGWRYLESAPLVLRIVDGIATVNYPLNINSTSSFVFGYYRGDEVKGVTRRGIGYGESNTEILITTMGEVAFKREEGYSTTSDYAALLCYNLEYNGFDDWFLPSIDELGLLISNVGSKVEGNDENVNVLWSSSSESNMTAISKFSHLQWVDRTLNRSVEGHVVPCRTF